MTGTPSRAPIASAAAGWPPSAARATTSSSQCPGATSSPGGPAAPQRRTRASVTCMWGFELELGSSEPHARQRHLRAHAAAGRAAGLAAAGAGARDCNRRAGRPAAPHPFSQSTSLSSPAPPMSLPGVQAAGGDQRACRTRSADEHSASKTEDKINAAIDCRRARKSGQRDEVLHCPPCLAAQAMQHPWLLRRQARCT
jgi:hypothetical protein